MTPRTLPKDVSVVLVVDDEPVVLATVSSILENAGFHVLRAASGAEALRIGSDRGERINLMLSDVVMPGLSGPSLADRFAQLHPETICLFMAGLPSHPEICERILRRGLPFLPKPFLPAVLVKKVNDLLGGSACMAASA